jgi:myo-inositol-1(or 4)-monophosphatase
MDIDSIRDASIQAVVEVGDYVAQSQNHIGSLRMKGIKNPQTDIDVRAEDMLREKLHTILPEAGFMVEEGISDKHQEFNWVIDPIDGTKFFSTQYPVFFTQIALMKGDQSVLSVVYCPIAKQVFHAVRGAGAYLNAKRQHIQYDGPLANSLVGLEIGKLPAHGPHITFAQKISSSVNRLMMVSTLLAPYLLTNTIQAYIRYYNGPNYIYDLAPRWLLHEEAGAVVHKHMYEGHELYISAHPTLILEIETLFSL